MTDTTIALEARLKVYNIKSVTKPGSSLRAFCEVEISPGLVIHDVMILAKAGRAWANLPSKLRVGRDGQLQRGANEKLLYSPIIEWGTKDLRERFSAAVIGQIQRTHPDLLDGV